MAVGIGEQALPALEQKDTEQPLIKLLPTPAALRDERTKRGWAKLSAAHGPLIEQRLADQRVAVEP
jgi:hypothetical protein